MAGAASALSIFGSTFFTAWLDRDEREALGVAAALGWSQPGGSGTRTALGSLSLRPVAGASANGSGAGGV